MLLSNCALCNSRISKSFKKQEADGLLSSLGLKAPLIKFPLIGPILF